MIVPGLFLETCGDNTKTAEFTLMPVDKEYKGKTYPSFHRLFLEANDPTGYKFAMEILGSYEHFLRMERHPAIAPYIEAWKEEVKARIDSEAIECIKAIAKESGTQQQLSAAKFLIAREYEAKGDVGRPSNKKSKRKDEAEAEQVSKDTQKELERLGLH